MNLLFKKEKSKEQIFQEEAWSKLLKTARKNLSVSGIEQMRAQQEYLLKVPFRTKIQKDQLAAIDQVISEFMDKRKKLDKR